MEKLAEPISRKWKRFEVGGDASFDLIITATAFNGDVENWPDGAAGCPPAKRPCPDSSIVGPRGLTRFVPRSFWLDRVPRFYLRSKTLNDFRVQRCQILLFVGIISQVV